jgi:multisubunit Na+/H+ antiporter MnhE subunit
MMRKLSWDVAIAAVVFWVLITFFRAKSISIEAFISTLPSVLIFTMVYAAIRVALVVLRKRNDE